MSACSTASCSAAGTPAYEPYVPAAIELLLGHGHERCAANHWMQPA